METSKRQKGETREDGKVFWGYRKDLASGEYWVTRESFDKKMILQREAWRRHSKTEKWKKNVAKKESSEKRILAKKAYRKTLKCIEIYKNYKKQDHVIQRSRILYKKYNAKRLKYHRDWKRKKRASDPMYKLIASCRCRLHAALRGTGWTKKQKTEQYLGCTYEELKNHLEKSFVHTMTWENYGEWEIDHIIPLSSAKNELELIKLCHYTNLQPLWKTENRSKGCRVQ
jgi:hypothetical protein